MEHQRPSEQEMQNRPEILKPGIQYVIIPGKGVDLVPGQEPGVHEVVATETSRFAAIAAARIYQANKDRPGAENLKFLFSGTFNVRQTPELANVERVRARIPESRAMALIAQEEGGIPASAIIEDQEAFMTSDNARNAARSLAGKEGGVATVTDWYQENVLEMLLQKEGVDVQQKILFEDVLRGDPAYGEAVARYEQGEKTRGGRARKAAYMTAYRTPGGIMVMRHRAQSRNIGRSFPVVTNELPPLSQ